MDKKLLSFFLVGLTLVLAITYNEFSGKILESDKLVSEEKTYPRGTQKENPVTPPSEIVNTFYTWYLNPDTPENRIPSENFNDSMYLTDSFKEEISGKIKRGETNDVDPFLCAGGTPALFSTNVEDIQGSRATVSVTEEFSEVESMSFLVELVPIRNNWKINNISCFVKG